MTAAELHTLFLACGHVSIDSRNIPELVRQGSKVMFFALKGENTDGNRYALKAIEQGAAYAVADDMSLPDHPQLIKVPDTLTALQELAAVHRRSLPAKIIAITGSNGKTTTKELLKAVLDKKYRCYATEGNYNNHIGVPITLLRIRPETAIAVVEMGANHQKEIESLCRIAAPDYGIITNIGKAHLEGFGGEEGIAKGKGELFDYLQANGGTAFFVQESEKLSAMAAQRKGLKTYPYTLSQWKKEPSEDEFLRVSIGDHHFSTFLVGDYNLYNIAAAWSIGNYFGVEETAMIAAISAYTPSNNRSQLITAGTNRIVMDAYNANPSSMCSALENFDQIQHPEKIIVLGAMKELGDYSAAEHKKIAKMAAALRPEQLFLVGEEFREAGQETASQWFATSESLAEYFEQHSPTGKLILIKGSNSIHLNRLLETLNRQ